MRVSGEPNNVISGLRGDMEFGHLVRQRYGSAIRYGIGLNWAYFTYVK